MISLQKAHFWDAILILLLFFIIKINLYRPVIILYFYFEVQLLVWCFSSLFHHWLVPLVIRFICSYPSCHICSYMSRAYFYIVSRLSAKHVVRLKWCFGVVLSHWSAFALFAANRAIGQHPSSSVTRDTSTSTTPDTHTHTNTTQTDSYKYLTDSSRRRWRRLRRRKRFMNFVSSICLW